MKPTSSPNDQEIIAILESLKSQTAQYPPELFAARRAAFIRRVEQWQESVKQAKASPAQLVSETFESLKSVQTEYPPELLAARRAAFIKDVAQRRAAAQEAEAAQERQVVETLESLRSVQAKYPSGLLAARRAAFIREAARRRAAAQEAEAAQERQVVEILESLQPVQAEYPADLLAARRAAFLEQIAQREEAMAKETEQEVAKLLASLKSVEVAYPPKLLASRRSVFIRQIRGWGNVSVLEALHSAIQSALSFIANIPLAPAAKAMRTSLVVLGLLLATFVTSLLVNRPALQQVLNPSATQSDQIFQPVPLSETSTQGAQETICKPGYSPPLCLAQEFDTSQDLTYQGNGARPAVAKDTVPGHNGIHQPAFVNDGHYGNGSSWISNSPYSWIKIDLGKVTSINTVEFGRDRLGNLSDGNPGQFTIAVALSDNVYADGNSSNDNIEYTLVYDSARAGFTGTVSSSQTVTAHFTSVTARFVKITFEKPGTAIDEVEAFMIQPVFAQSGNPTQRPIDRPPQATATPIPSNPPQPTDTLIPIPTDTLEPTSTPPPPTDTPEPTNTPRPTRTPTDVPTNTPRPSRTPTDVPPTDTPEPTNTPRPSRTPTDVPPTDTPEPTNTPQPPTEEPANTPRATQTDIPPTEAAQPDGEDRVALTPTAADIPIVEPNR